MRSPAVQPSCAIAGYALPARYVRVSPRSRLIVAHSWQRSLWARSCLTAGVYHKALVEVVLCHLMVTIRSPPLNHRFDHTWIACMLTSSTLTRCTSHINLSSLSSLIGSRDLLREHRGKRPRRKGYSRTGIEEIEGADEGEEEEEEEGEFGEGARVRVAGVTVL